jgi:cellulose synthase/poly-beta-1,6-N-acetylglucosamine synthase-like glycosyltransferase
VCVIDADVVVDPLALAASSRRFVEDESVVAVTGFLRPTAQAIDGVDRRPTLTERFQSLDHARRTAAAAGWSAIGAGVDAEGFVLYRRRSVVEIGGWTKETEAETILALHRLHRARNQPYRILHTSDTVGHMQPESGLTGLLRWRGRRSRSLARALWAERHMLLRRRYGRIGLVLTPWRLFFDVGSPFVQAAAYAYLIAGVATGTVDVAFAMAFAMLGPGSRIMLSQLAVAQLSVTERGTVLRAARA